MMLAMPGRATTAVLSCAMAAIIIFKLKRRLRNVMSNSETETMASARVADLRAVRAEDVPAELTNAYYFDMDAAESRGCKEHVAFLRRTHDIISAIDGLSDHVEKLLETEQQAFQQSQRWAPTARTCCIGTVDVILQNGAGTPVVEPERLLCGTPTGGSDFVVMVGAGARIEGGAFDVSGGSIFIGAACIIEPGVLIRGPTYIGPRCTVRHGAYLRGNVVLGPECVVGGELKNCLLLGQVECPHYGYVGDSLLGLKSHFGCGALTANLPLFATSQPAVDDGRGVRWVLGRRKVGAIIGDGAQLGCGCVTEPGCLLAPSTHVYPLTRLARGLYGGGLIKNRPNIERVPLRSAPPRMHTGRYSMFIA